MMRDSNQRTLKVVCVEIPVPVSSSPNEPEVMFGQTPPLQLLSFAAASGEANCEVELIPSDVWWPPQSSGPTSDAYQLGAQRILSCHPDLVVTAVNVFTWPVASRLLEALAQASGESPLRFVVGGINLPERLNAISKKRNANALFCAGEEESFKSFLIDGPSSTRQSATPRTAATKQALMSSIGQLKTWPRWEKGLANHETYGFPLDNQAHFWNLPLVSAPNLSETAEWFQGVRPFLRTLREPLIWLSMSSDSWNND